MDYQSEIGTFSTQLAKGSFLIGTLLLLLGLGLSGNMTVLAIGFFFVAVTGFINLLTLLALVACCIAVWHRRDYYGIKMLILLANLPIAVLYFFLVISIH